MRTILMTGPVGSGKSEAAKILEAAGYPVYISDDRTKALYGSVPGLRERIESVLELPYSRWKEVFASKDLLIKLEALVYPLVLQDFISWRSQQQAETVFLESAVAAQKPIFNGLYDEIWLIDAPFSVRCERNAAALQRDSLQKFNDITPSRTIVNDGSIAQLKDKIFKILEYEN